MLGDTEQKKKYKIQFLLGESDVGDIHGRVDFIRNILE